MIYNKMIEYINKIVSRLRIAFICLDECEGNRMAYNVMDIARFVVNYCNKKGYEISNLKLQKLLYFIQADYLSDDRSMPCFNEEIQAWNFGPVIPEVYHEFKMYGSGNIPTIDSYLICDYENFEFGRRKFNESVILPEDRMRIGSALDSLSKYSATTLVNVTHNQKPWRDAYNGQMNQIISKDSMREYFKTDEK